MRSTHELVQIRISSFLTDRSDNYHQQLHCQYHWYPCSLKAASAVAPIAYTSSASWQPWRVINVSWTLIKITTVTLLGSDLYHRSTINHYRTATGQVKITSFATSLKPFIVSKHAFKTDDYTTQACETSELK